MLTLNSFFDVDCQMWTQVALVVVCCVFVLMVTTAFERNTLPCTRPHGWDGVCRVEDSIGSLTLQTKSPHCIEECVALAGPKSRVHTTPYFATMYDEICSVGLASECWCSGVFNPKGC
jgi:hypothetical protein